MQSVTGPAIGATTSYSYDGYGRPRTATDSDGYTETYDYDALNRKTKITYPDSTFEETIYDRLDPARSRDRMGRWTHSFYDSLRRVTATTDPLGRTVTRDWCSCGSLESLVDANGNRTSWERDIEGRVTKEIRANGSEWLYEYESTTSRLKTVTDPKEQAKTYGYFLDDKLQSVSYTNEEHHTPNVSFTYDPMFHRVSTMIDGTGTTTYGYHPINTIPSLGAGRLASVDGPLTNDTVSYVYDELGRVESNAINGVALTYKFDALGRVITENSVLGAFSYQYDGVTSRTKTVTYSNGQTSTYAYYPNSGDHRLQEIHHRKSDATTISKLSYAYDVVGNITTWTQQQDSNPPKAYDFEYDPVNQLRTAVWRTTDVTPTILKRFAYAYDLAGNRTVEQIDNAPVLSAFNNMNQLTSQTPGGTMRFAGTLNEAATVTIQGLPAIVTSDNRFERGAQVSSGTNQVIVKAKDYAGNERTNTYEVSVSGSSKSFSVDANGNITGDGTTTSEWDAENRLIAINQGTSRTEFAYDYEGRRTRIVEKENEIVVDDRLFVWCGLTLCEERSDSTTVTDRYFREGVEKGGNRYFYTKDQLFTVREMVDQSGAIRARYSYQPYGAREKLQGDLESNFGFTGHLVHSGTGLLLAPYRIYSSNLGRWTSTDPLGLLDGPNLYRYVQGNPVSRLDPTGLAVAFPTNLCPSMQRGEFHVCCTGGDSPTICHGPTTGFPSELVQCAFEHEAWHIIRMKPCGMKCPGLLVPDPCNPLPWPPGPTERREECFANWITYKCLENRMRNHRNRDYYLNTVLNEARRVYGCNTTNQPWTP